MYYDVIGDVHGHAAKLEALLARLGYDLRGGTWHAPAGRQAVFVGDLIDRGPEQLRVLNIVRRMVDAGQARLVLGNHEFNAIGYYLNLRPRSENDNKNRKQHAAFLAEVGEDSALHKEWVDWFRLHPMALDLDGIRVVHAWWDDAALDAVNRARGGEYGVLSDDVMRRLYEDAALEKARKLLTCGVEWDLPEGVFMLDKEGHKHPEARLAVWRHEAERLPEVALVPRGSRHLIPDIEIPAEHRRGPVKGAPILIGHHWFDGPVKLESPKVACVDWSAAKDGPLVAYRWHGEAELRHENLVAVGGESA
jgi:hypothetical protein